MEIFDYPGQEAYVNYENGSELGFSFKVESVGEVSKDHSKSAHELLFVMGGCIEVKYDDLAKVLVNTMELVFLPKSCLYHIKVIQEAHLMVFTFDNDVNYLSRYLFQNLYKQKLEMEYNFMPFPVRGLMGDFLKLLSAYFKDGLNSRYLHGVKQDELFVLFKEYYTNKELSQLFHPIIGGNLKFKNKVWDNYLEAKTTEHLAELCGYSLPDFRKCFKENFHEPIYHWMQQQKAKCIRNEMLTSDDALWVIAERYGFSSAAHFTVFCKKHFDMVPTELKKNLKL